LDVVCLVAAYVIWAVLWV